MLADNIKIIVYFQGVDISTEIQNSISSLTYTDNSKNAVDDIEIVLENQDGRWLHNWYPDENARLKVGILQTKNEVPKFLDLGTFYVDEPTFSPNVLNLKCLALPLDENIREQKNSVAWQKITLSELINQIAEKHNMKSQLLCEDEYFGRLDQDRETDLAFLSRIISEQALSLKITNDEIVVFDEWELEQEQDSIDVFSITDSRIRDYNLARKNRDVFDVVQVSYYDADKKQHITETITKEELQKRNEVLADD